MISCFTASLIRGNRNNCTQFSHNLDWLVSKLERLESSSGDSNRFALSSLNILITNNACPVLLMKIVKAGLCLSGILEVLHCILIESPEALNIIQRGHIKTIISLLYKHGRNHKVRLLLPPFIRRLLSCHITNKTISPFVYFIQTMVLTK